MKRVRYASTEVTFPLERISPLASWIWSSIVRAARQPDARKRPLGAPLSVAAKYAEDATASRVPIAEPEQQMLPAAGAFSLVRGRREEAWMRRPPMPADATETDAPTAAERHGGRPCGVAAKGSRAHPIEQTHLLGKLVYHDDEYKRLIATTRIAFARAESNLRARAATSVFYARGGQVVENIFKSHVNG